MTTGHKNIKHETLCC